MRGSMLALLALGASSLVLACSGARGVEERRALTTLSEAKNATAINFLEYERRGPDLDVMLVTGRFGLKSYSLEDPAAPELLDELAAEELRLPGDPPVDFDRRTLRAVLDVLAERGHGRRPERKLALLSRDPRAYAGSTTQRAGRTRSERRDQHRRRLRRRREGPGAAAAAELPAAADRSHDHVHQRLRVAVDGRPRRHRAPAGARVDVRAPDHRHRPQQPAPAAGIPDAAGRPVPARRPDRLLARRPGRRRWASRGCPATAARAATGPRAGTSTRSTRSRAARRRSTRSRTPAAACRSP